MRKILVLPQAQEDLDEITDPLFSEIIARIKLLADYPLLGPAMDGPFQGYRALNVQIFRIIYRLTSRGDILIAYIRHVRENPS